MNPVMQAYMTDESTFEHGVPYSAEWYQRLRDTLGDAACRQLGFFEIPAELLLSVVIPVYNEEESLGKFRM